jgi:DNA-binding transcriptional LysR family regulator
MPNAPLSQLQVFLVVARLKSFSAAARELGVSTSAVSQAVRSLEDELRVPLLTRTTRSVAPTDAGRRLLETAGPALAQATAALTEIGAQPGEIVARLKLNVPRAALLSVIAPVLPVFRARHPRIEVEVVVDDRFVDIVAQGYDAGVRLSEAIERDMVQVRVTPPFRFLIVGSPDYLAKHGTPERPEDLLRHECITFRSQTTGALYAWELEREKRTWRVPVRGGIVVTTDGRLMLSLVENGLGLAYVVEPSIEEHLRDGRLRCVLEAFAPSVPGFFLYFPSRSQSSSALRAFVEVAKEVLMREKPKRPIVKRS